jgi:hypothetical protein
MVRKQTGGVNQTSTRRQAGSALSVSAAMRSMRLRMTAGI